MAELQISINLDNAAFEDNPQDEVKRILTNYCNSIRNNADNLNDKYSFIDFNGNQVGEAKVILEPEKVDKEPEEKRADVIIGLSGGLIQWIFTNSEKELDALIVDFDVQGGDYKKIEDFNGVPYPANIYSESITKDAAIVNHYYDQLTKIAE
jgi:hypothetical protein